MFTDTHRLQELETRLQSLTQQNAVSRAALDEFRETNEEMLKKNKSQTGSIQVLEKRIEQLTGNLSMANVELQEAREAHESAAMLRKKLNQLTNEQRVSCMFKSHSCCESREKTCQT
jgi:predicted  nucleic acid-binding Zn-ribbon protein